MIGDLASLLGASIEAGAGIAGPVSEPLGVVIARRGEVPPIVVIFSAMMRIGDPIPVPAPLDVVIEVCGIVLPIAVIARAIMRIGDPAAM